MILAAEVLSSSTVAGCPTGSTAPVADGDRLRIPVGDYRTVCYKTRSVPSYRGSRKLVFYFRIVEGEHAGTELSMYCNYPRGKLTPSHKLYRQWALAIGRRPSKNERFAQRVFRGKMYLVLVRDAKPVFSDGSPHPEFLTYSVVDTI